MKEIEIRTTGKELRRQVQKIKQERARKEEMSRWNEEGGWIRVGRRWFTVVCVVAGFFFFLGGCPDGTFLEKKLTAIRPVSV